MTHIEETRAFLRGMGLPERDAHDLPTSEKRFPDGAQYRIEIPSTEGPRAMEAVLDEAHRRGVTVHRISQGSGVMLLTDDELHAMATLGRDANVEVSLFVGPKAAWDTGAMARVAPVAAPKTRGADMLVHAVLDVRRAVDAGILGVLVADEGLLWVLGAMKAAGQLPPEFVIKISVMQVPSNPATAKLLENLGAGTLNVATDLTLPQLAAIRQAVDIPLDIYIEAPDNTGGFVRHYEVGEIVRCCAPVYVKAGLRNAADVYPSGTHLEGTVIAYARERVRRAQIALEHLHRLYPEAITGALGAPGLAIPTPRLEGVPAD